MSEQLSGENEHDNFDIKARLLDFDPGNTLLEDAREIWSILGDDKATVVEAFWFHYLNITGAGGSTIKIGDSKTPPGIRKALERSYKYTEQKFTDFTDPQWVESARKTIFEMMTLDVPMRKLFAGFSYSSDVIINLLHEKIGSDVERFLRLSGACRKLAAIEFEVMSTASNAERIRIAEVERHSRAAVFKDDIGKEVENTSEFGHGLRTKARYAWSGV